MEPPPSYTPLLTSLLSPSPPLDIPHVSSLLSLQASIDSLRTSATRRLILLRTGKERVDALRQRDLTRERVVAVATASASSREKERENEREKEKERQRRDVQRDERERERKESLVEQRTLAGKGTSGGKGAGSSGSNTTSAGAGKGKSAAVGGGGEVKMEQDSTDPTLLIASTSVLPLPPPPPTQTGSDGGGESDSSSVVALTHHRKKKKRKHGLITSDGESERNGRAGSEEAAPRERSVSQAPPPPPTVVAAAAGGPPIRPKIKLFTSSRRSPSPLPFIPMPSVPSNIDFSLATGARSLVPPRPPIPAPPVPGPMNQSEVNEDFSNVKPPPNQVLFGTFWQGIEPYVRQIGEEDLAFLKGYKDEDTEPYVLPPLGKPYQQVWEEEDRLLSLGLPLPVVSSTVTTRPSASSSSSATTNKVLDYPRMSRKEYEYDSKDLKEEDLVVEDKGAGPLTERVVSALLAAREEADAPIGFGPGTTVREGGGEGMEVDGVRAGAGAGAGAGGEGGEGEGEGWGGPLDPGPERLGMGEMEARMRKELQAVGLLGEEEVDWSQRADDEISTSLRQTQRLLASQVALNSSRRTTLLSIAQDRLAYAEYLQCLEGLDRIIDSGWHKRQRLLQRQQKRKENTKPGGLGGLTGAREREKEEREKEQNRKIGEALKVAIGRRKKFVEFVGGVFKRAEEEERQGRFWGLPGRSVYEEEEEQAKASGSGTVAEDEEVVEEGMVVVEEEGEWKGGEPKEEEEEGRMEGVVVE
ncbi:histone acetyltransferases subunit 3-domain-containing protein [Mrakia frigida]|uniref:histone acetyltransferase NGG1 n=1 Tax=Mrakia frigida TaxID=29902 RepID=UPI003FCC02A9